MFLARLAVVGAALQTGAASYTRRRTKKTLADRLAAKENGGARRAADASEDHAPEDRHLALSLGLVGMTAAGSLGAPLLAVASLPGLLYLDFLFLRRAYTAWQEETQAGIAVTDAVLATGLIATRQFAAEAIFATLYFTSRKLLHQTQAKARQQLDQIARQPAPIAHDQIDSAQAGPPAQNGASLPVAAGGWAEHPEIQPSALISEASWETLVDRSAVAMLALGAISAPLVGAQRALTVLLSNFGYDYRVVAPLSVLNFQEMAGRQGILIQDGRDLTNLQQVDAMVFDEQMLLAPTTSPATAHDSVIRPETQHLLRQLQQRGIALYIAASDPAEPAQQLVTSPGAVSLAMEALPQDRSALLQRLQQEGHTVCLVDSASGDAADWRQADVVVALAGESAQDAERVDGVAPIILQTGRLEQLSDLFGLADALAKNLKQSLLISVAPSIINLGGIYFLRFGTITALLVEYGGLMGGMVNASWPRWRSDLSQDRLDSLP